MRKKNFKVRRKGWDSFLSDAATHNQKGTQSLEFLPDEWRDCTTHWASQILRLAPEGCAPKTFTFENQWGSQICGTITNWETVLKKLLFSLTSLKSSAEAVLWKVPRHYVKETHLLILKHCFEKYRPAGIHSGDESWWKPSSFSPSALLKWAAPSFPFSFHFFFSLFSS